MQRLGAAAGGEAEAPERRVRAAADDDRVGTGGDVVAATRDGRVGARRGVVETTDEMTAAGKMSNIATEYLYIAQTSTQRVFKTTLGGEIVQELAFPTASGKYENPAIQLWLKPMSAPVRACNA